MSLPDSLVPGLPVFGPKLMGLDVSRLRIGIAFNDPLWLAAQPRTVLSRSSRRRDFTKLCEYLQLESVEIVICGLPVWKGLANQPQALYIQEWARRFVQFQKKQLPGQARRVIFWDEQYTSAAARAEMSEKGIPPDQEDAWAAALLLEDYMKSQSISAALPWGSINP